MFVINSCQEILSPIIFMAGAARSLINPAFAFPNIREAIKGSLFVENPVGADMVASPVRDLVWFTLVLVGELFLIGS